MPKPEVSLVRVLVLPIGVAGILPGRITELTLENARIYEVLLPKTKAPGKGNSGSTLVFKAIPLLDPEAHDTKKIEYTTIDENGLLGHTTHEHLPTFRVFGDPKTVLAEPLHPDTNLCIHKLTLLILKNTAAVEGEVKDVVASFGGISK